MSVIITNNRPSTYSKVRRSDSAKLSRDRCDVDEHSIACLVTSTSELSVDNGPHPSIYHRLSDHYHPEAVLMCHDYKYKLALFTTSYEVDRRATSKNSCDSSDMCPTTTQPHDPVTANGCGLEVVHSI